MARLAAIARSQHFTDAVTDRNVAKSVAQHKSFFFIEKDAGGAVIDYAGATQGYLNIVPDGKARDALAEDYAAMLDDDVMVGDVMPFDQLMKMCSDVEARVNEAAK